jgi:Ankyrin repeats (3 copies)/Ankyrin repeat
MAHFPPQLNSTVPASAPQANTVGSALTQLQPLAAVQDLPQHQARNLLQEAWIWRNFGTIRALLEAKLVDPNSFISDCEAPEGNYLPILAHACQRGDTELVRCLLDHGAQPGFWMLATAFDAGHDDVVRLMAKHVDIDTLEGGISLLHTACVRLDQSAVERLIGLGADVKKRTYGGVAPLVLVLTLSAGADPDRQVAVMTKLLDAGADIEARFRDLTPLSLACFHNNIAAVSQLLKRGAKTDPHLDTTRTVIEVICEPSVSVEIFEMVVVHEPRLWFSARAQLDGLDDEQSRRKIICMHHTRAPLNRPDKHMPRTGPKVDTI